MTLSKRSSSYIVRNPYSYCFRMNVPKDLHPYVGKKELRYSLSTGYLGVVKLKARYLASHVQLLFRYIRRNRAIMSKLLKDQIPELVTQYIKTRFKYLKGMFEDARYLDEFNSYKYEGDDLEGFVKNSRDNMANSRYQMADYCSMFLNSGYDELEMLADNIKDLLQKNGVDPVAKKSPAYRALSAKIHDAEVQILPLEADRLKGGHTYKQELSKLFPFLENNRNQQSV